MFSDISDEVFPLVNWLKSKMVVAIAVVMIKHAKAEGIPSDQYTKAFQEKYFTQNYEELNTNLKQTFLSHCHDDVLRKLRMAIPVENKPNASRKMKNGSPSDDDGNLLRISKLCNEQGYMTDGRKVIGHLPDSTLKPKDTFSCEESAMENIRFIQSMMSLIEESEKETPVSTNLLHSLLYEQSEEVVDLSRNKAANGSISFNHSSDSGIGTCSSSNQFTESSCSSLNSLSTDVVKLAIQTSKTKHLVLNSVRFVVEHLERRIREDIESVFQKWEGSEFQFMNRIVCKCSQVSSSCREVLLNFIYNILDSIWLDEGLNKNRVWEMKILIVSEFITDNETCKEVIQYSVEKFNYFTMHYAEKPADLPEVMDKLFLYVNIFSSVCDTLISLKSNNNTDNESRKDLLSENYISAFWQEKLYPKEAKKDDEDFEVSESDIQSLERLCIVTSARHPLLASLAHEAILKTRLLVNPRLNESQSDFDCSFSLT